MPDLQPKTSKARRITDRTVYGFAIIGIAVLLNVLSVGFFGRFDLTTDGLYSLSEASVDTVKTLEDPVSIRAYFTADLPAPYSSNARYVRDLLDEYAAHSRGMLQYQFIDPIAEETKEDKAKKKTPRRDIFGRVVREQTSAEFELMSLGIPPVQIQVNEGDKLEVKRAYMGIAIRYGEKQEVIPVVQETAGLEYDLTSLIRKLVRSKTPAVAFITGHDEPTPRERFSRTYRLLAELYDVKEIDLSNNQTIGEEIDGIIVAGPKTPFTDEERRAIDQFIMTGNGAAFLLDRISVDLSSLRQTPTTHGLDSLSEAYGVTIGDGLVLDVESSIVNVTQQRRFLQISQPVPYPYIPLPKQLDPDHPLTRGLTGVSFPFVSPLQESPSKKPETRVEMLVASSSESWVRNQPFDLHPLQNWDAQGIAFEGAQNLVAVISGTVKSPFADTVQDATAQNGDPPRVSETDRARIVVIGGSSILDDQFTSEANQAFALNLLDWMLLDDALLSIRARGLTVAPLDDISDAARNTVKYANMLGLPAGLVIFGLIRWRIREARRQGLSL